MDRGGVWQATVHKVAKNWTQLKQLSTRIHLHIWSCWYFSWKSWFQLMIHPAWYLAWYTGHMTDRETIYSFVVLLSQFWTSQLFHVRFWLLLLDSHTGFTGDRQGGLVFPSLLEFFTVCCDPYSVFSEEVDVFLEFACFLYDPMGVDNLISGSSAFSKSSLYIWKLSVHILLKPSLKDFEHNLNSMWNEHNCSVILEKTMAPHSSTLAWKIPWMEEPSRLQSMGSLRVRHDWVISLSLFTFMHWRRKWQPTPVFLHGESQGWGSLVGCYLWGHTESDMTEVT